ncbi:MAG: hypothetical protein IJX49_01260, partial [Clostridia bacterium]|nr:hypothetical protein [Clostridia bacterium]
MKKNSKKLLTLALVALFVGAGAGVGAVATYNGTDARVAMAAIADMTKVTTAIDCAMPLEEGKVKQITDWGYYDSDADGVGDVWAFKGDGTATAQPEIRFSTPGTDTTPANSSRVYKPMAVNSISVEYNITNSGTALAESSTTKYLLQILGALEGTGSANQYYYHIPEIIDDGEWHTLTIDLNSAFTGGSNENLPMNISSFDDINELVCCWNLKLGQDFNGEVMLRNFTVVEAGAEAPVEVVHDLKDAFTVDTWGGAGDYTEALLYRIKSPAFTDAQWSGVNCNDTVGEAVLKAIKVNGKSVYDHNADYKAKLEAGETSPITWTGMPANEGAPSNSGKYMQPNIVEDVKNGTAVFAPIFVNLCNHGAAYGSTIDMYIPSSYLKAEDITSIEISEDFLFENEGNKFGVSEAVTFKSNSLCIPKKYVGEVPNPAYNIIETTGNKMDGSNSRSDGSWDSFMRFHLSESDYSGSTIEFADKEFLQTINFYDYILIDGVKMGALWRSSAGGSPENPGEQFFNVWSSSIQAWSMRWPRLINNEASAYAVQEIKILAGCQFPSQTDPTGTLYEVKEDITLVSIGGGVLINSEYLMTNENVVISEASDAGDAAELLAFDITFDGWNSTCDSYDYNYFGEHYQTMRKNILINGVSLWEINKNTDDSAYVYSTSPWTNDAIEPSGSTQQQLFQNPTLITGAGNKFTIYVHKQYVEDNGFNTVNVTINKGFASHANPEYFAGEDITATVWAKDVTVTVRLGGNPMDTSSVYTVNAKYGDTITLEEPTAEGKTFAGW